MLPRVSVVIVTYNSEKVLQSCLRSLGHHEALETIVIDNDSSDGSFEIATREVGHGRVIRVDENLGFSKAVNLAAKERHPSTRWIVLLNPDAEISAVELMAMVEKVEAKLEVGIISPIIRHPDGRLRVMPFGREPTIWRMFCHFSGLSRMAIEFPIFEGFYALYEEARDLRTVDWVSGACMAVRAEVWDSLNGLSERWFMYAEDVEFCHRVRLAKWRVVWDPSTTARHRVGTSSGEELSKSSAWIINLYDYYKEELNSSRAGLLLWRAVVALGLLSRAGVFWFRGSLQGRNSDSIDWNGEAKRFAHFGYSVIQMRS